MARDPAWGPAPPDFAPPPGMCRDQFNAMGTRISTLLPDTLADAGFGLVRSLFEHWEQTFSRFRPESELSNVNDLAGRSVVVSPLFLHVLETALEAARSTDGIYDPTLLHQLVGAGYDRSFDRLPNRRPATRHLPSSGGAWRSIEVDRPQHSVTLPEGVGLDFGGIAKGMAVDAALDRVVALGAPQAAVEAGGDLRVHGSPPGQAGWTVAIQLCSGFETITLSEGALATSSVARRRWLLGGTPRHHLLDPRSGESTDNGLWSVTVAAPRCAQADVAAKAAFILGPRHGAEFLIRCRLDGLFISQGGERRPVGSWPKEPDRCKP
jgi:FAD:protein FMN transferase